MGVTAETMDLSPRMGVIRLRGRHAATGGAQMTGAQELSLVNNTAAVSVTDEIEAAQLGQLRAKDS